MFVPRTQVSVTISATQSTWQDTGLVLQPGEVLRRIWNGTSYAQFSSPGSLRPPNGALTADNGADAPSKNVTLFSVAFVARPPGSGNPGYGATGGISYDASSADKPSDSVIASGGRIWAVANDTLYTDNSGAWGFVLQAGSYVYPSIQQGTTQSIAIEGSYSRGSGGWDGNAPGGGEFIEDFQWIVDKPDYSVAGNDTTPGGWNAVLTGSGQIAVTVPPDAAVGQFYAVYIAEALTGDYKYAVFHVVPAPLLPPKIVATARLINNVPVNRLVIS